MTIIRTDEWTDAHFAVNERLTQLLNQLRDAGYNPSFHISYDHMEHHLIVDHDILEKHPNIAETYDQYLAACATRDQAVENIQAQPKLDLGF
ncbi:hypothetical protein JI721_02850 [Alicyclobacillus cycloheptanicus]|uniref:Uncharacterized protein n=1 Tax=Alicyclobacillus cycloheptanicus TaxID=1457 RepID=A0ABT9XJX0_9BACL|nr:hypothetical protein [Alicyclobacillus cycloheptanicus]MDQ0190596.1 hypothetical protein [Alicyclobacillus cycloheptanicus]WDM01802.1 hypothetical protein JI721_02850 [Alicyclobacillus cycloheptanicus]